MHIPDKADSLPLFIPVLPRPSGDRFVTIALHTALLEKSDVSFVVAEPIEAYDATMALKSVAAIEKEVAERIQTIEKQTHAVLFYTGRVLIHHLRGVEERKFATTHLSPQELLDEVSRLANQEGDQYEENWHHLSLCNALGLDMLACPAHMAVDLSPDSINDPNIFWSFGVPALQAPETIEVDNPIFDQPVFVVSIPAPDAPTDQAMQDMLVRVIRQEEIDGTRHIVLVDNPRSQHFTHGLLALLGKDYPLITKMGAFTQEVLPGIKKNDASRLFLPGDSASVITESIEALPWQQIIVNDAVYKDTEQSRMVPFFFEHGRVQLFDKNGRIVAPTKPDAQKHYAAGEVADAAIRRFVKNDKTAFTKPDYFMRHQARDF